MRSRMGFLYGLLVAMICALGVWWIYYLTVEGRLYTEHSLQKMANDRLHAAFLIRTDPEVASISRGSSDSADASAPGSERLIT